MADLQQEIREFVVENFLFGRADVQFRDEDSLIRLGIVDSTGVLELIQHLQDRYAVKVEDAELTPDNLDSVANLARFVVRKRNGAADPS